MNNGFNLSIPETLRGVKLHQWVKFMEVYEKNKDNESSEFLDKKMIEILCEVSLKDLALIPIASFDTVLAHLYDILNTEVDLVNTFKMVGSDGVEVEFGFIPKLDEMTYGEWQDLETYMLDNKNLHRAMAVLYRPLVYEIGGKYRVHPYKGTDFYADVMKEMPIDIALGARVFFYRLVKKLGNYTMDSILKQYQQMEEEGKVSKTHSEKNGEDIRRYLLLQEEMSEELKKLQNSHFITA